MPGIQLRDYQIEAVKNMHNGCILCGGVGSGKSITGLAYYYIQQGGKINTGTYEKMFNPKDLYIITTAKKRDSLEWEGELTHFLLHPAGNIYGNKVVIDSWNNIKKYVGITDAFFIFDEQRVVGYGAWTKSFLKITKSNDWILLSATPGDTWMDYIPVFIANGFYKNKTAFINEHVVYKRNVKFPVVDRYLNTGRLMRLRKRILVGMDYHREAVRHNEEVIVNYDTLTYKDICKRRWNIFEDKPIENASEFCQCLRRVVNTAESRQIALLELVEKHPRSIIFYNYDFELELLRDILTAAGLTIAEWNGHKHQEIPDTDQWCYLVQYNAGSEGWNCVLTDTIIFYSQTYSYRTLEQASGRIDRMNTPYFDLYYYHLRSRSGIDLAIKKALGQKKKFNESNFYGG